MRDAAVIGAGLIGSAAARHLAESGTSVTLIDAAEGNSTRVHASHYDEARITRRLGPNMIWSDLAAEAMRRYSDIEMRSGIRFHSPCGHLRCDLPPEHERSELSLVRQVCSHRSFKRAECTPAEIAGRFPELAFPAGGVFHWEPGPAGIINPRQLIRAQIRLARRAGADVVNAAAVRVRRRGRVFDILDTMGNRHTSGRVLVAAGAYTSLFRLTPVPLSLTVRPETVVLMEVAPELRQALARMPSLIWHFRHIPDVNYAYVLPPVVYPDGRSYIKIGSDYDHDQSVSSLDELDAYMRSAGSPRTRELLVPVLQSLIPRLAGARTMTKPCLLTYTPSEFPMVDELDAGWFVAAGGCGKSAKSSDQIGKLAAQLVRDEPWTDFARGSFAAVSSTYKQDK